MKFETAGQLLKRLRTAAGLSQLRVALEVGVSQIMYSHWERDDRRVPVDLIETVARVLGIPPDALYAAQTASRPNGRPPLPRHLMLVESRKLPQLKTTGTLEDVAMLSWCGDRVVTSASRRLPPPTVAAFLRDYPRDSPWELYVMLHLLTLGACPARLSLATQRCPLLAVEDYRSLRQALQQSRPVLVLDRGRLLHVFTPQVWVVSPTQSEWYRLDFLCGVFDDRGNCRFADLEFDTFDHDEERDRRRARGICAPRISIRARDVDRPGFGSWLIERLARLLDAPEPTYRRSA